VSIPEARKIQESLRPRLEFPATLPEIRFIAGCDMAIDKADNTGTAGVIVYRWPELEEVERRYASAKLTFPYVPGFLSFREAPVLLEAIAKLEHEPDLFFFDGQGIAHPRGLGIASHLGLILDKPSVGCAKSRLCGEHGDPPAKKGGCAHLVGKDGKRLGAVLRTRDRVHPVFVSPGHKIDIQNAVRIVLSCCDGYRIPKPTREADHFVEKAKRGNV